MPMDRNKLIELLDDLEQQRAEILDEMFEISKSQITDLEKGNVEGFADSIPKKDELSSIYDNLTKQVEKYLTENQLNGFNSIKQYLTEQEIDRWELRAKNLIRTVNEIQLINTNLIEAFQKLTVEARKELSGVKQGQKLLGGYKVGMGMPSKPTPRFIDKEG